MKIPCIHVRHRPRVPDARQRLGTNQHSRRSGWNINQTKQKPATVTDTRFDWSCRNIFAAKPHIDQSNSQGCSDREVYLTIQLSAVAVLLHWQDVTLGIEQVKLYPTSNAIPNKLTIEMCEAAYYEWYGTSSTMTHKKRRMQ